MHNNTGANQYKDEVLIETTLKTTKQTTSDERLIEHYDNADEALKNYPHIGVNARREPDLDGKC